MGDGRLQKLVENIQNFSDSEDLRRAIDFLATSYESPLETAFFMTFSAMETIVNLSIGSASAAAYNTTEWSKIRTALKEAIDRISVELSIEGANLLEKLPEMERPSFKKRVTLACSTLSPKTSDIWPDGDFIKGMQGAARLRNGLFHAAKYSDHNAIADSLIRIRTFTERLLTKLLKVADEDLWPHRDNELRRLNSSRLSM
jgi:hypothetical protein